MYSKDIEKRFCIKVEKSEFLSGFVESLEIFYKIKLFYNNFLLSPAFKSKSQKLLQINFWDEEIIFGINISDLPLNSILSISFFSFDNKIKKEIG